MAGENAVSTYSARRTRATTLCCSEGILRTCLRRAGQDQNASLSVKIVLTSCSRVRLNDW